MDRQFFNKREEDKKDDSKSMFPLVSVWVRHEDPGNYTHIISLPRNYSYITKSGTSSNFEIRNIAFCLLVVSTVSTSSTVSSQVSEHFLFYCSLVHCLTTLGQCVIAYLKHIHCSHLAIPGQQNHKNADTNLIIPSRG